MRNTILTGLLLLLLGLHGGSAGAAEKVNVVCTLPHLASIARAVASDRADVRALATGRVDPHYVIPTPGLMAAISEADLFVEIGMSLEIWSERALAGARNPSVRPGQPGHVYAYQGVVRLEVPAVVSRAQGDVHPLGNPHIWLDPLNGKVIAANVAAGLKRVDPDGAATYDANLKRFQERIDRAYFGEELVQLLGADLLARMQRSGRLMSFLEERKYRGEPLSGRVGGWLGKVWTVRGTRAITYHRTWAYFARAFGIQVLGELEAKPGIPPTPGHLTQLERQARAGSVKVVLVAPYFDLSRAEAFAERIGARAVAMPTEPGVDSVADYFGLFDALTGRLAEAAGS